MNVAEELYSALEQENDLLGQYHENLANSKIKLSDFYYEMYEKDEDSLQDLLTLKHLLGEVLRWEHEIQESESEVELILENLEAREEHL